MHRRLHEHLGGGDEAPGDHDARYPEAGAKAHHRGVGRNLQKSVADEEDAAGKAIDGGGEAQILVYRGGGEAEVQPVDDGDQIGEEQERQQPPLCLLHHAFWQAGRYFGRGDQCPAQPPVPGYANA